MNFIEIDNEIFLNINFEFIGRLLFNFNEIVFFMYFY